MHIKSVHMNKYKRFTDLTIKNIPETAKLVILLGPNGCGKSSVFDALKTWHGHKAYSWITDNDYCKKDFNDHRNSYELVNVEFYEDVACIKEEDRGELFYFRTAHRNSPKIEIHSLSPLPAPTQNFDNKMMIESEACIDDNYQRFLFATIDKVYSDEYDDNMTKQEIKEELVNKLASALRGILPDLEFTGITSPTKKPDFKFKKGNVKEFSYTNLSGGEKAVFELFVDMLVKAEYYQNTVFCIDEPETHIHTDAQFKLIDELLKIIPDKGQLWIATHSFGILKRAAELAKEKPEEIVFINFDGKDFDDKAILEPSSCNQIVWQKILDITLGNYTQIMPDTIVLCEGNMVDGKHRKNFDAMCYTNIFKDKYPNVLFCCVGNCDDVESGMSDTQKIVQQIIPNRNVIKVIDLDDRSEDECKELSTKGIRVLSRRNIESYILDNSVLEKWCNTTDNCDKYEQVVSLKERLMERSVASGKPDDDYKQISGELCQEIKKLLGVKQCGNNSDLIMRDTLSKLITSDMDIYKELDTSIFG